MGTDFNDATGQTNVDGIEIARVEATADDRVIDIPGFANEYEVLIPDLPLEESTKVVLINEVTGDKTRIIVDPDKKNLVLDFAIAFEDQEQEVVFNRKQDSVSVDDQLLTEDIALELDPGVALTNRLVSFSGGGWNSHSILAGLLSGALDASKTDLKGLFSNVQGISANSGGTWFLSMLAYSDIFRSSLENAASRDQYNQSGYNGQVRNAFSSLASNSEAGIVSTLSKILDLDFGNLISSKSKEALIYFSGLLDNALSTNKVNVNWRNFVEQFVYGYDSLSGLKSVNLDSSRLAWAQGKDFTFATAISANPTVIQNQGGLTQNKLFTGATPSPSSLPLQPGGNKERPSALPLLLVSDASNGGGGLSAYGEFPFGDVDLTFSTNAFFGADDQRSTVTGTFTPRLSIIDATTASSSAVGGLAAPENLGNSLFTKPARNVAASYLRELAPLASFKDNILTTPKESSALTKDTNLDDLTSQSLARLVDGAYIDNTSVAYGLRELQRSYGIAEPFEITLLLNSTSDPVTGLPIANGSAIVPGDIAKLFGFDGSGNRTTNGLIDPGLVPGLKQLVPTPWVFNANTASSMSAQGFSYSADNGSFTIQSYDFSVTTVDNPAFGIRGGQQGTFRVISTTNNQSQPAPFLPNILDEYDQNYNFARDAIATKGWSYFSDALGLTPA
jgi:hypothetical protein